MLFDTENRSWLFFVTGTFVLTAVFVAQYSFDIQPCPLCLWQRVPWEIAIFVALCDRLLWRKIDFIWAIYGIIFLISAGLAFYHVGVERHLWKSFLEQCNTGFSIDSPEQLLENLQGAVKNARCDERIIFMFDFSFADWNFLLSSGLAILSLLPFIVSTRRV